MAMIMTVMMTVMMMIMAIMMMMMMVMMMMLMMMMMMMMMVMMIMTIMMMMMMMVMMMMMMMLMMMMMIMTIMMMTAVTGGGGVGIGVGIGWCRLCWGTTCGDGCCAEALYSYGMMGFTGEALASDAYRCMCRTIAAPHALSLGPEKLFNRFLNPTCKPYPKLLTLAPRNCTAGSILEKSIGKRPSERNKFPTSPPGPG